MQTKPWKVAVGIAVIFLSWVALPSLSAQSFQLQATINDLERNLRKVTIGLNMVENALDMQDVRARKLDDLNETVRQQAKDIKDLRFEVQTLMLAEK